MKTKTTELKHGVLRTPASHGECQNCVHTGRRYHYRFPGWMSYRISPKPWDQSFCSLRCAKEYWS